MVSKLIYAPLLAASLAYANETPKVAQANDTEFQGTARAFAYTDFAVGIAVGTYGSLIRQAYDGDCFSAFFNYSFGNIYYSQYYDTGRPTGSFWNNLFFGLDMLGLAFNTSETFGLCMAQLAHSKNVKWYENFNLMSDMTTSNLQKE